MIKTKFTLLALLLFPIGNGSIGEPIIIRHDVPDQKYIEFAQNLPIISAIVKYSDTDLAGTLIAPQWVLSAAHVAETIPDGHQLIVDGDSIGIEKIIIHSGWNENGRPDLALIKLDSEITSVDPILLYRGQDEIGKEIIVAGHGDFGTGETGPDHRDGTMRAATNLVDGTTSDNHYLHWLFDKPGSNNVTSLEGISGPGDSSGPAFIKEGDTYYLVGVSSAQSTSATGGVEGLYGVTEYYVRVSTFVGWIEKEINKN